MTTTDLAFWFDNLDARIDVSLMRAEYDRLSAIEDAARVLVADTVYQAGGTTIIETHKLNHLRGALGQYASGDDRRP